MSGSDPREDNELRRSFSERLAGARAAAAALTATRAAIFREELADKGAHAARAMAGFAIAVFLGSFSLLLATALIAAVLAKLLGSPIAGVAATLALYLAVAAAGAVLGWKALERVRPFEFPATGAELAKDVEALSKAAAPPPGKDEDGDDANLEARYRAGSE
jgi:uncharacterized membrane protein YqjE